MHLSKCAVVYLVEDLIAFNGYGDSVALMPMKGMMRSKLSCKFSLKMLGPAL
jgi:hypothetical protein